MFYNYNFKISDFNMNSTDNSSCMTTFKTEQHAISNLLLKNETSTDLTFVVQENLQIKAHKVIIG